MMRYIYLFLVLLVLSLSIGLSISDCEIRVNNKHVNKDSLQYSTSAVGFLVIKNCNCDDIVFNDNTISRISILSLQNSKLSRNVFKSTDIQHLTIEGGDVEPEIIEEILDKNNLFELHLVDVRLTSESFKRIGLMPLTYLTLSHIPNFSEFDFLLANTRYEALNLSGNGIKSVPKEISNLTLLSSLNLSSNQLNEFPIELQEIPRLTNLYLENNNMDCPNGEYQFAQLTYLKILSGNNFGKECSISIINERDSKVLVK